MRVLEKGKMALIYTFDSKWPTSCGPGAVKSQGCFVLFHSSGPNNALPQEAFLCAWARRRHVPNFASLRKTNPNGRGILKIRRGPTTHDILYIRTRSSAWTCVPSFMTLR